MAAPGQYISRLKNDTNVIRKHHGFLQHSLEKILKTRKQNQGNYTSHLGHTQMTATELTTVFNRLIFFSFYQTKNHNINSIRLPKRATKIVNTTESFLGANQYMFQTKKSTV